jgi:hypothetical protein
MGRGTKSASCETLPCLRFWFPLVWGTSCVFLHPRTMHLIYTPQNVPSSPRFILASEGHFTDLSPSSNHGPNSHYLNFYIMYAFRSNWSVRGASSTNALIHLPIYTSRTFLLCTLFTLSSQGCFVYLSSSSTTAVVTVRSAPRGLVHHVRSSFHLVRGSSCIFLSPHSTQPDLDPAELDIIYTFHFSGPGGLHMVHNVRIRHIQQVQYRTFH